VFLKPHYCIDVWIVRLNIQHHPDQVILLTLMQQKSFKGTQTTPSFKSESGGTINGCQFCSLTAWMPAIQDNVLCTFGFMP
jgi:hypothetical protein